MADGVLDSPLSGTAEYRPQRGDSHRELARPETSFLEFFKQSLIYVGAYCTEPSCCTFLDNSLISDSSAGLLRAGDRLANQEGDSRAPEVDYPLALFERLGDLPPFTVVHHLASEFLSKFVPSVPFLSKVLCLAPEARDVPFYLLLSEALFGAAISDDVQTQNSTETLWRACVHLATGTVEVDNSLGREIPWLTAASLIVAFGSMQSDLGSRRQTNILNGYLQATLFQPDFIIRSSFGRGNSQLDQSAAEADPSALRSFYFIVDTLRSIHFHTPSTVEPTWSVRLGPKAEYDFRSLCDALIVDKRALPADLAADEYALILLSMLSDINTLSCSVGPLTSACHYIREEAIEISARRQGSFSNDVSSVASSISPEFSVERPRLDANPHVPFTADHEYKRLQRCIAQSLDIWIMSFRSRWPNTDNRTDTSDASVLPLFHFSRLLLEVGPAFYIVPVLAGYAFEEYGASPDSISWSCDPHKIGIQFGDAAVQIAVEILESVEADYKSQGPPSTLQPRKCHPLWYPLAVFYGALVVWGRVREDEAKSRPRHILFPLRRLLPAFQSVLEKLKEDWKCANLMAEILAKLSS